MKKPSKAQRKALQNLKDGLPITAHLRSVSDWGGFQGTSHVLHRNKWIESDADGTRITEAGLAALNR